MRKQIRFTLLIVSLLFVGQSSAGWAAPPNAQGARQAVLSNLKHSREAREASGFRSFSQKEPTAQTRKPSVLPKGKRDGPGSVPDNYLVLSSSGVQGSIKNMKVLRVPSVLFDKQSPVLKRQLRRKAAKLRMLPLPPWDKVKRIQQIINKKVQHAGNELDVSKAPTPYNLFNQRKNKTGKYATLSEYLKLKAVVCRENAMLTQVALEDAGFEARLVYGNIQSQGEHIGDHAWNEIKLDGKWHIVDTTNPEFNRADPTMAGEKGTANGWIWKRSHTSPAIWPQGYAPSRGGVLE